MFCDGRWVVKWVWSDEMDTEPILTNSVSQYNVPKDVQCDFELEVKEWISNGWLQPYDRECKALLPLMAVVQCNKDKVRPVFNSTES